MNDTATYWAAREDAAYLRVVRGVCDTIAGDAKTVLDVGSFDTPILEWRRGGARRLVSIDLRRPYVAEGVESITCDFLDYPLEEPFDLVTCLQVLEHVPDAAGFAQKLLAAGRIVVVSVPYKWPKGECAYHLHDPVDERVMRSWFGRLPTSHYIAREPSGVSRLIQVYRTVSPPPPAKQPRTIASPDRVAISVAHGPRTPAASWPLFSLVRNEAILLPHFFRHYRRLGVDHFFIYDDQSTDETPALLRAQPDCTVLTSPHRFGDVCGTTATGVPKRFCSVLREMLPMAIAPQGWSVVVDADEFLILPPGIETLPQMCRLLDDREQWYATAPMVDFYPESFAALAAAPASTPFEACPYFDVGPLYEWGGADIQPRRLFRGIRARLHRTMAATQPWVVEHICGARQPEWMAKCWKVPLLRNGRGITRQGDHEISVPPATNCDVALAHFKFFTGFDRKVVSAVDDGQYYGQSVEYRLLDAAIKMVENRSLLAPESRRYQGPESLVAANLLQAVHQASDRLNPPSRGTGVTPSGATGQRARRELDSVPRTDSAMPQQAFVHQIFYDDRTRIQLDPGFLPLDNCENLRPDWSEYWPIRRFVLSNSFLRDAGYGFFSPKFAAKTGLTAADVYRFVAEQEADVFLFSPWLDVSASAINVFEQAGVHAPGIVALFAEVLAQLAPGIDARNLVMDSRHVVFCNFFIARPAFWQRWFSLCESIFRMCEAGTSQLATKLCTPVPHAGGRDPAKVFLIERIASFILATEPQWNVRAYDSSRLPLRKAPATDVDVLLELDALKRAWRTDGNPEHLRAYDALRASLVARQGPPAGL